MSNIEKRPSRNSFNAKESFSFVGNDKISRINFRPHCLVATQLQKGRERETKRERQRERERKCKLERECVYMQKRRGKLVCV